MVHCYNLAFRGQPLSSQLRLQRGVGWYKFAYGFVVLRRMEHYTGDRSIVTIDHQLQKEKRMKLAYLLSVTFSSLKGWSLLRTFVAKVGF